MFALKLTKLGLVLALLTPLVWSSRFMYPLVFPRVVYFRIIVELTAVAFLAAASQRQLRINWRSPVVAAMLAFFVVQLVAAVSGENPYASFTSSIARSEGVITLVHLVAFFLMASSVLSIRQGWRGMLDGAVLILTLEGLLGISQYFHLPGVPQFSHARPNGTTGNAAFFATLMAIGVWLPLAVRQLPLPAWAERGRFRFSKSQWSGWYLAVSGLSLVNLWLTQIRGANFALLAVTVGWLCWRWWQGNTDQRRRSGAALLVVGSILAFVVAAKNTPLVRWDETLYRLSQTSWESITLQNRLISWGIGIQALRARPLLGWGPENYPIVFNRFFNPKISRDFGSFSWYDRAHSAIVDLLVGSGVLGLVGYLAVYGAALGRIAGLARTPALARAVPYFTALLITHFLTVATAFDTINSAIIILAVLASLEAAAARPRQPDTAAAPLHVPLTASAAVVAAVIMLTVNILPAAATYHASKLALDPARTPAEVVRDYTRAFRFSPPQRHEFRQGLGNYVLAQLGGPTANPALELGPAIDLALTHLGRSVTIDPQNLQSQLIFSELTRVLAPAQPALLTLAERSANAVIQQAPARYHGYFALGRVAMSAGRHADGIAAFQQAVARYPAFAAAHWNLAIAYILDGQLDPALASADRARQLDPSLYWSAENIDKLGRALHDQGFSAAAAALFRSAADREAERMAYFEADLQQLMARGDRRSADLNRQQADRAGQTAAEHYRQAANILYQLGQSDEAAVAAREAVRFNPAFGAEFSKLLDANR